MNQLAILRQHKHKEGWLEKKSPTLIIGYQKRYFTICEDKNTLYLLYDKIQPTKDKKPKGAISFLQIDEIISKEGTREFTIKYGDRNFILRAPTLVEKTSWIETLEYLRQYAQEQQQESQTDITTSSQKKDGWKFKKLDPSLQRDLRIHIEKKNQGEDEAKEIEVKDEQMQKAKGLFQYFSKYNEEIQMNHIVQGFLFKKKERFTNKVAQPKKRWFMLYSEFPLTENARQDVTDFDLNDLPPFINPNVLYHYGPELDDQPAIGSIHIKYITNIKKGDLKVEGNNVIKKGFENIGNQVISVVNKITEITKLDKIGAHIHRFEFQFQITTNKNGQEVTHSYYSESLLQIEKWVSSLNKIVEQYKQREELKASEELLFQQKQASLSVSNASGNGGQSESADKVDSTNATDGTNSVVSGTNQAVSANEQDSSQNEIVNHNSGNNLLFPSPQSNNQAIKRNQIIFQNQILIKASGKIRIVWSDRIGIVRRQIISIYKDEKDLKNEEAESYITIKDIQSIMPDKGELKLKIIKKNKEERRIKFKNAKDRNLWFNAIQMLIDDEETSIEDLQKLPEKISEEQSTSTSTPTPVGDEKATNSINDEESQVKHKGSRVNSFQSVDSLFFKAYQQTSSSFTQQELPVQRKQSFFSRIFSCCGDPREANIEEIEEEEELQNKDGKKLLLH